MTKRKPVPKTETAGSVPAVATPEQAVLPAVTVPAAPVEPAPAPAPQVLEQALTGIVIVRSVAARGRWRIGRHFTQAPTEIDVGTLTEDQLAALAGDPDLICAISD